jgi:hypothetical protein
MGKLLGQPVVIDDVAGSIGTGRRTRRAHHSAGCGSLFQEL